MCRSTEVLKRSLTVTTGHFPNDPRTYDPRSLQQIQGESSIGSKLNTHNSSTTPLGNQIDLHIAVERSAHQEGVHKPVGAFLHYRIRANTEKGDGRISYFCVSGVHSPPSAVDLQTELNPSALCFCGVVDCSVCS